MASCNLCKTNVGCSCNLIPKYDTKNGVCHACHEAKIKAQQNANISPNQVKKES